MTGYRGGTENAQDEPESSYSDRKEGNAKKIKEDEMCPKDTGVN